MTTDDLLAALTGTETLKTSPEVFEQYGQLWCRVCTRADKELVVRTPFRKFSEPDAFRYAEALQAGLLKDPTALTSAQRERVSEFETVAHNYKTFNGDVGAWGYIYLVQLYPDALPIRIKVGRTAKDPGYRLRQYHVTNPEAVLVACWHGNEDLEQYVLRELPGRVDTREVFDLDVDAALILMDSMLGARIAID